MGTDSFGNPYVDIEGQVATYSGQVTAYTPYATATDMVTLVNPASSLFMLRLMYVSITGTITTANTADLFLQWRNAPDTGGTITPVASLYRHDSLNIAATGILNNVSVAPTLNGAMRQIRAARYSLVPITSATVNQPPLKWEFGTRGGSQAPRIRPGEQIAVNFNGAGVGGGTVLFFEFEWTETTPAQ